MEFDINELRKRRKELIDKISETNESSLPPFTIVETPSSKGFSSLQIQITVCVLILAFVIVSIKGNFKWGDTTQQFTRDALIQDFDFEGTTAWIEAQFGQFPSLIPTLQITDSKDAIPVFSPPLQGVIVESFSPALTGVIIETGVHAEVRPIAPGLVREVDKRKGMGIVVVIQHGNGKESTYGFLGEAFVKQNDWVYPDRVIGTVNEQSLFLQIRDKAAFIDPLDVVTFD